MVLLCRYRLLIFLLSLLMQHLTLPPDFQHYSTVHRIIVDHRSWENFEKFADAFSRNYFLTALQQHPLKGDDVTFLYYLYMDPNDLYQGGRHSYERYLRAYRSNSGNLIVQIGTCSLFDDQSREVWQEEEKTEAKDLDEVCELLYARFVHDLAEMESFFH